MVSSDPPRTGVPSIHRGVNIERLTRRHAASTCTYGEKASKGRRRTHGPVDYVGQLPGEKYCLDC